MDGLFIYEVVCKDYESETGLTVARGAVTATDYGDAATKVSKYFAETLESMGLKQCESPFIDFDENFIKRYFTETDIELPGYDVTPRED